MPKLLKGRELAGRVRSDVAESVLRAGGRPPGLAVILVGQDPASETYVASKQKACEKAGIVSVLRRLDTDASEGSVLRVVSELNADDSIDGILCQLPLPPRISPSKVAAAIDPDKDVDGLHPVNVGCLWRGEQGLFPCTPRGIVALLAEEGVPLDGASAVIIGRSNIVGKPLAAMLLRENCTVTLAHSHTRDLPALSRKADLLVAAVGRPGFVGPSFVRPGMTVVDVGISRTEEGLRGDVDFDAVADTVEAITPVPGGVGPLTIAFLLANTLTAWKRARQIS
ncbi:bifunctional methylenetetrahydrofolate dehydrogenase/methenyltetrahydrofolate cyclohydrolase FolD [Candidatus Fermentibacterales bacterium]|nr:bifunctional methylenetetrahydrofolate dehydrogenase/methenyltetrahydrofolate cyclohydrolase FolD [Candidatus Fermentibacterales bacterium]